MPLQYENTTAQAGGQPLVRGEEKGPEPPRPFTRLRWTARPFCQSAYFLDDHGFLILAEKAAEGVGDFAERSVGFDGIEDGREKIFRCVGTALEFGKGGGHAVRIATGAESFEPGD